MKRFFPVICAFSCLIEAHSFAGSATWVSHPTTDVWHIPVNWTPATVPNSPTDTATFGPSAQKKIRQGTSIFLDGMVFSPGASPYTITNTGYFNISGTGIVNNSGRSQTITCDVAESGNIGTIDFTNNASSGDTVLIANGGTNGSAGGGLHLFDSSVVGGRVEVFGNGTLDISGHDAPGATIGSLEGDGIVIMGGLNLTVGSNLLTTKFSGALQGNAGSSLTKIGTGTLTLSGANNTYQGGTTVSAGTLLVKNTAGSATGSGAVQVNGGILGGKGIIAGAVTIGTGSASGSSLQPGKGATNPTILTLQSTLTFKSDGTYTWKLNTNKAKADQVIASGITIESGAQFELNTIGNTKLTAGKVFTAISNAGAIAISGTFANLADGSTVTVGVNKLQISYSGGDGNDLTLTVVP